MIAIGMRCTSCEKEWAISRLHSIDEQVMCPQCGVTKRYRDLHEAWAQSRTPPPPNDEGRV